jgi:hypothetical protein
MKRIKVMQILFFCLSVVVYADQEEVKIYEQLLQDLEIACRKTIDTIFDQARGSIEKKEDIITSEWLARKEIKEIQNNMSDACIELSFKSVIPEKIQDYLHIKIRDEVDKLFESKDVSVDQVKQFFDLSELLCRLSQGTNCHGMMRAIKDENFPCVHNLRTHKKVLRQIKKEERRNLCERIVLGAQPR